MKNKIFLIFLLCGAAFQARAFDIDRAARDIALNNPELAAAAARYDAELNSAKADNALSGLDIDFDYKFGKHENKWGGSVTQAFDWPGLYSARRRTIEHRQNAFAQLYRADLLRQTLAAKQALLELARAQMALSVLAEAQANVDRLESLYVYAFERGETTILEVRKLRLQAFSLANSRALAEAEVEAAISTLKALNGGVVPDTDLGSGFPSQALAAESEYVRLLTANDPTVAAQQSLLSVAEDELSEARRSALPSFKAGYAYENEGGESFHGFTVGISLPTWTNSARKAAAAAGRLAVEQEAVEYALRMRAQLTADYAAATRLSARLEAAHATFDSDEYPQLLRKALDAGRINLFDYLREYNDYLDAKSEYIELEYNYATTLARLNRYNLLQ